MTDRMQPPRDNLVRAIFPGVEVRDAADGGMPTLTGHFSVFNEWTKIDSLFEGTFMERVAPGAFAKTFAENRSGMRVTFNHGKDPNLGDKVLGPIADIREDRTGAYYEVPLFDTTYNRDLLPGLRAGVYGSSFRFRVVKEDMNQKPARSAGNPTGLPERTIKEAQVMEFGPVTYPAYAGATAGVRSLTDVDMLERLLRDPEKLSGIMATLAPEGRSIEDLAAFLLADKAALAAAINKLASGAPLLAQEAELLEAAIEHLEPPDDDEDDQMMNSTPKTGAERAHSVVGSRDPAPIAAPPIPPKEKTSMTPEERAARDREITDELARINGEYSGVLPADVDDHWKALTAEQDKIRADQAAYEERVRRLEAATVVVSGVSPTYPTPTVIRDKTVVDIYDTSQIERMPHEQRSMAFRDNAYRAVESTKTWPNENTDGQKSLDKLAHLLDNVDSPEKHVARRILYTGSPVYKRAFNKILAGGPQTLTPEEQRGTALAVGVDATGGYAVPFAFDPTMIAIGSHQGMINPFRANGRVVQIAGTDTWNPVTATAVTATRTTEAAAATEQGPTFAPGANGAYIVKRVHAFVTYSTEMGQDRPDLASEISRLISEAKDNEEEASMAIGAGTTTTILGVIPPNGTSNMYTYMDTIGSTTLAAADAYAVEAALPVRWRFNARWVMNRGNIRKFQALETVGGILFGHGNFGFPFVGAPENSRVGNTGLTLLGYPVDESPSAPTAATSHICITALYDPSTYIIVDRVGMNVELIPNLFNSSALPTGQRGIYALWRNHAAPLIADSGRVLGYKT